MTDARAFLDAILANPDCDTVRLVYADWLDENGEPRWAAFIRSHVAHPDERRASSLPVPLSEVIFADECWSNLPANQIVLSRGFACAVECTAGYWLEWAEQVLAAHPVRKVSVTGIPFIAPGDQGWTFLNDPTPTPFTESEIRAEIAREAAPRQPNGEWLRAMCRLRWPGIEFELPPARPGVERFDDINEVLRRIATTSTVPAE